MFVRACACMCKSQVVGERVGYKNTPQNKTTVCPARNWSPANRHNHIREVDCWILHTSRTRISVKQTVRHSKPIVKQVFCLFVCSEASAQTVTDWLFLRKRDIVPNFPKHLGTNCSTSVFILFFCFHDCLVFKQQTSRHQRSSYPVGRLQKIARYIICLQWHSTSNAWIL